ncbi:MAG: hypothetical protein CMR00_11605 [[Chlorobium] sp. 445]|nr:MAG: hypothetical protein CMR00_11605 [[Chlorobium] sp. 445]
MKTVAQLAQMQTKMRWYAERPFAYRCRDEYQQRMTIGLIVAAILMCLSLGSYFISTSIIEPLPHKPKEIWIDIIDPPPPPAPENNKPSQPTTGSPNSDIITVNTGTSAGRAAVEQSVNNTITAAFSDAINSGLLAEGHQGPPVPQEGTQGGLLSNQQGGEMKMSGTSLMPSGLTTNQGPLAYLQGAQVLKSDLNNEKLGGNEGNRVTIAKRGTLTIRESDRRLQIQTGGRSKEEILATVRSYQAAIQSVYTEARQAAGRALKGNAVVRLVIAPDGAVRSAEVVQCSINNDNFKRALVAKARKMQFSKIAGATLQQVDIPYEFGEED